MATDAEAQAAGFVTPTPQDLISGGDDAISTNARVTLEQLRARDAQIAAARAVAQHADAQTLHAALNAPTLAPVEQLATDEFGVRFRDGQYFVRANERDGITSRVGGARFEALDPTAGFMWAVAFRDPVTGETRVDFGRRNDGTLYDATRDGSSEPGTSAVLPAPVVIVGDSLAAAYAGAQANALSTAVGVPVTVRGRGGQTSRQIAARQGGLPTRVTLPGNVVPAGTAPVSVTMTTNLGVGSITGGNYPGAIAGVLGTITVNSDATATFARDTAGTARPAPAGSPFVTGVAEQDMIPVIISGRNNYAQTADVVEHARRMLAYTRRPLEALVLSVLPWVEEIHGTSWRTNLDATNAALLEAFPTQFVDWAAHLRSEDTLRAEGITPTATDLQNIADGVTPASFRTDGGHVNAAAYSATTKLITDHYRAKGLL